MQCNCLYCVDTNKDTVIQVNQNLDFKCKNEVKFNPDPSSITNSKVLFLYNPLSMLKLKLYF